jgi:protein AroM
MSPQSARLAFLTIGQAPRHDLSAVIEEQLPSDVQVTHAGVLDGLSAGEIEARFAASGDDPQLISKLQDGSTVILGADAIEGALRTRLGELEDAGVDIVVVLCTGEFPTLRTRRAWLVEPDAVVTAMVVGLLRRSPVGIVVPREDQVPAARQKWRALEAPAFAAASPYNVEVEPLVDAAHRLVDAGARTLVLDCMGYGEHHRDALREAGITVPVLVSGSLVASGLAPVLR